MRKVINTVALILTVGCIFAAAFLLSRPKPAHRNLNTPRHLTGQLIHVDDREADSECHYAVVCGGIHSLAQLRQVIGSDPLAASLYAGFLFKTARITTLQKDVWAYVAYRRDGHIFYTHEKRRIRAGESVLIDGSGMMILTRCGNLLQTDDGEPQGGAEPSGIYPPADEPVDSPPTPPNVTPPLYAFVAPTDNPPPGPPPTYQPVYYPPCCTAPPRTPPQTPTPVAEPGSFGLSLLGLVVLCGFGWTHKSLMEENMIRKQRQRGFSLIELMVVVAVILIIVAIAVPNLLAARKSAQTTHAAGVARTFGTAQAIYAGRYNNDFASTPAQLMGTGTTCDASGSFPAPSGGPAATWHEGGYSYLFTPGSADPAAGSGCASPGTSSWTFTAVPDDSAMDAIFVDQTLTVRHGVGTATVTSAPLGQ